MLNLDLLIKLVDPDPVQVRQDQCLRVRHRRSPCRDCSDVCPDGAIDFAGGKLTIDPAKCSRCGLCTGACPTAALELRGLDDGAVLAAGHIRCRETAGGGTELPCLGWLSADHLVELGLRTPGAELAAGDCGACRLSAGGKMAGEALARAAAILRELGVEPPRWVHGATGTRADTDASREVSRRELLALWRHGVAQTGRSMLPDREVNPVKLPTRLPARRVRWLRRAEPGRATDRPVSWPVFTVADGCIACNICVGFCPTSAMESGESDGRWRLYLQPAACVDCGTCVHLCPINVLRPGGEPVSVREILSGSRQELAAVQKQSAGPGRGWQLRS